ncbi:MAG TPA: integrase [Verrucomicrobia bacterium]|nr:MAG: hypothetical protein A2X46_16340 [Lentisphaerae bacterium GWF2_57_35]HBA83912.1 integrase [Verrucomicrobiota bacterium]
MALELKAHSKWWYARFYVDGKPKTINLQVEVAGKAPVSLRDTGDRLFEQSKSRALQKHDDLHKEIAEKKHSQEYIQRLHEIRTGRRIESVPLSEMLLAWDNAPRKRKGSAKYIFQAHSHMTRFVTFLKTQYPDAKTMADVTSSMASAFFEAEGARGVSGRTCNSVLILLRSVFKILGPKANIIRNPFDGIPTKDEDTIHRMPFNQQELARIIEASKDDAFIRPILIVGICTAMRRGDCCSLRWADVDMKEGFVSVKTSKTQETVDIPMFPMLRSELEQLGTGESEYVFPQQALMYQSNPLGITYRVRKVFEKAGFSDDAKNKTEEIHAHRENGLRRASIRDFHSFRVTWITLALSAGVPLELVQRVTGHKTTDVVLKHYFKPGREQFRQAIQSAMPKLLTNGAKSRDEQMLEILDKTTAKTWKQDCEQLRILLKKSA